MTPMITVRSSGRCIERMELARTPSLPCRRRHRRLCPRRLLARLAWLGLAWLGLAWLPIFSGEAFVFCTGTLTRNTRSVVLFYAVGLRFCVFCVCPEEKGSTYMRYVERDGNTAFRFASNQGSAKSVLFFVNLLFLLFFRSVRATDGVCPALFLLHERAARGARSRVSSHAWDQTQTGTLSWVPGA